MIGFLDPEPSTVKYFSLSDAVSESTPQVKKSKSPIKVEVVLNLSDKEQIYERSAYNMFTLIGDIGGFNGAITILPSYFMSIYSSQMFKMALSQDFKVHKSAKRSKKKKKNRQQLGYQY